MIYICIPTHNEQQTVGVVLWKLRQVLTDFPRDYQLLVVDDASSDKTPDVLEPYTRVLPLTVVRSERRLGYAASLELLLREAVRRSEYPKRDIVVAMQADFSDEPDDVEALVKRLEAGADIAVGNKVSTARDTRVRRLSRAVARFFTRRVKWPEGVETPFDGYRAYRLYAVRKALEDRQGGRLIRYDGWAGHAELLRAVLPHARRVDVVNVDDRVDRLQRPRRERPFAAALQVRALKAGSEPMGLVSVEELDRIAATASRSRERAALSLRPADNGRGRRNGGRTRERSDAKPARARGVRQERGPARNEERSPERPTRKRQSAAEGAGRRERPKGTRPARDRAQSREPRRPQDAEPIAAVAPAVESAPPPVTAVPGPTEGVELQNQQNPVEPAESRPKRKRRRRRRTGGRVVAEDSVEPAEEATLPDEAAVDDSADAVVGGEGSPQKKRRRRGGRRGGRGRRKPGAAGSDTAEPPVELVSDAPAESAARVESD